NGDVQIYDDVVLLSGELKGSGKLKLENGVTITVTGGTLDAAPDFGNPVYVVYDGATSTSGPELPAIGSGDNADVTVSNAGVILGANALIRDLTLSSGYFTIGANTLEMTGDLTDGTKQLVGDATSFLVLNGANAFTTPSYMNNLGDLTANRTSGVSMGGNLEVHGTLTLGDDLLPGFAVGAHTLTLNNAIQNPANQTKLIADGTSSITIAGTSAGIVVPTSVTALNNLTLVNANGTGLQGGLTLNSLTLTDGLLTLGTHNLSTAAITHNSVLPQDSYILTNADVTGRFTIRDVTVPVVLPIGYSSGSYTPVTLGNNFSTDYTVAINQINSMSDFTRPLPTPEASYVQLQWEITRSNNASGSVGSATFTWNPLEGYGYAPTYVGYTPNAGTVWTPAGTIVSGATTTSVSVSGIENFGSFAAYKATPVITWSNPANITYGDLLSATQLNAVAKDPTSNAEVAGSYVYDPDLGTMLSAGTHQALTVTFNSTSLGFNRPVSKTVYIDVDQKELVIGISADNKVYNGNRTASTHASITSGLVGTDDVTVGSTNGLFNNKNVGTGKAVTADVS
ncbi:MAG: YDG domain-containing protein, partial [Bacteroidales bacterium]